MIPPTAWRGCALGPASALPAVPEPSLSGGAAPAPAQQRRHGADRKFRNLGENLGILGNFWGAGRDPGLGFAAAPGALPENLRQPGPDPAPAAAAAAGAAVPELGAGGPARCRSPSRPLGGAAAGAAPAGGAAGAAAAPAWPGPGGAGGAGTNPGHLPGLARLALPGVGIGPEGIRSLCQPGTALQSLQVLDLSLNPLGSSGGRAVAALLAQCPALVTLRLQGCGLTEPLTLPEPCPLRSLALSHNPLGRAGLRRLLRALPARSLRGLELAAVTSGDRHGDSAGDIGRDVAEYLQQAGCALRHLSLAGNHLRDGDITELARSLPACPSLLSLDLSANPRIPKGI
ncbi:tonsoku-like protein [Zonotrichia albicollis]|uniref:tonsoku-like protein n=1 Tax=Zonotrichia albicollis TaxID=44394 RepID=UPI003D80E997